MLSLQSLTKVINYCCRQNIALAVKIYKFMLSTQMLILSGLLIIYVKSFLQEAMQIHNSGIQFYITLYLYPPVSGWDTLGSS